MIATTEPPPEKYELNHTNTFALVKFFNKKKQNDKKQQTFEATQ